VFDFHWNVQAVDPNGTATIALQVASINLQVTGPGGQESDYDSSSTDEPRGFAATLAPLFKTLLNSELVARVNVRGEVLELQLPEDLQTVLRSKPAGKALGQLGSEVDLEGLARLGLPALPDSADFSVGDKWEVERTVEMIPLGSMTAHTEYLWDKTSEQDGEQLARIALKTTFRFSAPAEGEPTISSSEQLTSGQILFNLSAGRLESLARDEGMNLSTSNDGSLTAGTLEHSLKFERITNSQ
jgi:hypothetical protein